MRGKKIAPKPRPEGKLCGTCKKVKPDTHERENPFVREIYGRSVIQDLCDDCFYKSCEDI